MVSSAQQPLSLKHTEARERAALLEVTSYDVALDLDRGDETFGSVSTITVVSHGGPTFLEVQPVTLNAVTVNGRAVDVSRLDRGRVPIDTDPGENVVVVDAVMRYRHDGEGLHRSVDPADGCHYVYAMTFLDAAPSIFGCFDQPDLKAVWNVQVRAPHDWVVLGNSPATQVEPGSWVLAPTLPLSTYLVALVAGPYHVVRSEHDGIPLGLSARASIARHLDHDAEEIFTLTAQSFDEFHRLFGVRYPFGDYHQAFVPEFNAGAMESAGCVTFRDPMIFQSRVVRTHHVVRASTIVHEMAHMWFGDLVTPAWWDDLWLNESFAEYMGARVTADVTEFSETWVTDVHTRRSWGLTADQRPSTHAVAGNGAADGATALQNFDGISYAKGATIIKQLNARLGDDVFFRGVSDHFEKHRFGNATMADLLAAWERAGAGDLASFRDGWLLTAGPDRIVLDRAAGVVRRTPLEGHPADRDHALSLASAADGAAGEWNFERLVLDADEVAVAVPDGPVVVDPHVDSWAVTLLDDETLAALPHVLPATEDQLLRASAWVSVRNAFQHALLAPEVALDLVERIIPHEDTDDGVGQTLGWAIYDVATVATDHEAALARLHDVAAARASTRRGRLQPPARRPPDAGGDLQRRARVCTAGWPAPDSPTARSWTSTCAGGSCCGWPSSAPSPATSSPPRWPRSPPRCRRSSTPRRWPRCPTPRPRPGRGSASAARSRCRTTSSRRSASACGRSARSTSPTRTSTGTSTSCSPPPRCAAARCWPRATQVFYPRWSDTEETVARAHALLARDDVDTTIRRELVDETWDLERRLAIRRAFGGPA